MDATQIAVEAGPYLATIALAILWRVYISTVNAQCVDFRARLTRVENRLEDAHKSHSEFAREMALASRACECPLKAERVAGQLASGEVRPTPA